MAASQQPEPQLLRVAYDYEYDYKTRKVSVKQGEILHLLQQTNEHWWKVVRPGVNKPFFVPAQYVTLIGDDEDDDDTESDNSTVQHQHGPTSSASNNNKDGTHDLLRRVKAAVSRSKSNDLSSPKAIIKSKLNRNEGTRASHRDRLHSKANSSSSKISSTGKLKNWSASLEELSKQIVFPGLTSESVADLTVATRGLRLKQTDNPSRDRYQDHDEDGLPSFLCDSQHINSINKCLTFRNPSFSSVPSPTTDAKTIAMENSNNNKNDTAEALQLDMDTSCAKMESDCTLSRSVGGTITKEPKAPGTPTRSPVRILADNWAEYYSPDNNRHFYYNSKTKCTSWKPPRNSSNKKFDEHHGSSLSDRSANASSFEKSLENIPDLVGSPNLSFETGSPDRALNSDTDNITNTLVLKGSSGGESRSSESVLSTKLQQSEDEGSVADISSNNVEIPIPEGWDRQWDDVSQQISYVNKLTGAKWFASTDPQERVYFYEENSSNSSWFLPVPDASQNQTQSPTSKEASTSLRDESWSERTSDSLKQLGVKKRHSAGETADRNLKTKSLLISTDLRKHEFDFNKTNSLPRSKNSIWINGKLNVLKEGLIARSKITENGKKLRKSWGVVYAVLTESHLSLFKDQKSFMTLTKTEVEIELEGTSIEWTDLKSSRKNVFQVSSLSDLQMLFQVDDKELAMEWFDSIKCVTDKSDSVLDISLRLRSTESPDNLLDPPVGERKISLRLNRNKSNKFRITTPSQESKADDRKKITDHLKKFFSRRPPRESLVKKGIYKDESVFGCSLEKLCALEKTVVPRFVLECIVAIESKEENLKTDGIYRASGNLSQVQKIRFQVDQNNMACLFQEEDVHVLAGCLKLFFRELKEPLIPSELFEKALQACHTTKKEKVKRLQEIVNSLPKPNRCTLQALLAHLLKVAAFAEFNRMKIENLAIVFGPTLMCAAESQNMATDLMQQNRVIDELLVEYESIFQ